MEKAYLPPVIESNRLILRKHEIELASQMFNFVEQDRKRLREFLPWVDYTTSVENEKQYISMTQNKWHNYELFDYGMFRSSDQQYLGNIGIHSIAWDHERCEIGYWILGEFEGQGYVSEAVQALERACFSLGFNRIEIRCSSKNLRSASVPIRCGYRLEATLKQDSVENGSHRDTFIFGKLKNMQPASSIALLALDFVYLFTEDLKRSREWYQKVLNIEPTIDLKNFVEFRPGGHCGLCLHPADEKSPMTSGGSVGYWRVIDFKKTLAHFESHGARIYRGPLDIGQGESICQLKDPIGNFIGLVGKTNF